MTGDGKQLPLDLRHRAAMGREDFLVSPSNADAVGWVDRWPDWPGPAVVLVGPPGSGKSHLGQVWRERSGADVFEGIADAFVGESLSGASVLVDDADRCDRDTEMFHLFNAVSAAGGHMLFAVREAPARWQGRLPDLVSRLSTAPTIQIHAPDETLIAAVMMKMFADRQLDVGAEVLAYLTARMERSFEEARTLVEDLDRASLASHRGVTMPLAREIMSGRYRAG